MNLSKHPRKYDSANATLQLHTMKFNHIGMNGVNYIQYVLQIFFYSYMYMYMMHVIFEEVIRMMIYVVISFLHTYSLTEQ